MILLASSISIGEEGGSGGTSEPTTGSVNSNGDLKIDGASMAMQLAICSISKSSPSMADCATNTIKSAATNAIMQEVAKSDPDVAKVISTYQQINSVLKKGGKVKEDLKIDNEGTVVSGEIEPPPGEKVDLVDMNMMDKCEGAVCDSYPTGYTEDYPLTSQNADVKKDVEEGITLTNKEGTITRVESGEDTFGFNKGEVKVDPEKGTYKEVDVTTAEAGAFTYEMGSEKTSQMTKVSVSEKGMDLKCNQGVEGCEFSGKGEITLTPVDEKGNPIESKSVTMSIKEGDKGLITTDENGNYVVKAAEGGERPTVYAGDVEFRNVDSATLFKDPETGKMMAKLGPETEWIDKKTGWSLTTKDDTYILEGQKKDQMLGALSDMGEGEAINRGCIEGETSIACWGSSIDIIQEKKGINIKTDWADLEYQEFSADEEWSKYIGAEYEAPEQWAERHIRTYKIDTSGAVAGPASVDRLIEPKVALEERFAEGQKMIWNIDDEDIYVEAIAGTTIQEPAEALATKRDIVLMEQKTKDGTYATMVDKKEGIAKTIKVDCPSGSGSWVTLWNLGFGGLAIGIDSITGMQTACQWAGEVNCGTPLTENQMQEVMESADKLAKSERNWNFFKSVHLRNSGVDLSEAYWQELQLKQFKDVTRQDIENALTAFWRETGRFPRK